MTDRIAHARVYTNDAGEYRHDGDGDIAFLVAAVGQPLPADYSGPAEHPAEPVDEQPEADAEPVEEPEPEPVDELEHQPKATAKTSRKR